MGRSRFYSGEFCKELYDALSELNQVGTENEDSSSPEIPPELPCAVAARHGKE